MKHTPHPMVLVAGPCIIESEGFVLEVAQELKHQLQDLPVDFYFKASFDKANRSSKASFRGPGLEEGLQILSRVKEKVGVRVFTDFHTPEQAERVAREVDFIQVPAFLCRQTDMIDAAASAAARYQRKLNVKKGQFLAPWDAKNIVEKVQEHSLEKGQFYLTERGASFGYNRLVVDMISFQAIQAFGVPVLYDATHSVQKPGAGPSGKSTGGQREYLEVLARAAMAAGADGLFLECHPNPPKALSDAATSFNLGSVAQFVGQLLEIRSLVSAMPRALGAQNVGEQLGE